MSRACVHKWGARRPLPGREYDASRHSRPRLALGRHDVIPPASAVQTGLGYRSFNPKPEGAYATWLWLLGMGTSNAQPLVMALVLGGGGVMMSRVGAARAWRAGSAAAAGSAGALQPRHGAVASTPLALVGTRPPPRARTRDATTASSHAASATVAPRTRWAAAAAARRGPAAAAAAAAGARTPRKQKAPGTPQTTEGASAAPAGPPLTYVDTHCHLDQILCKLDGGSRDGRAWHETLGEGSGGGSGDSGEGGGGEGEGGACVVAAFDSWRAGVEARERTAEGFLGATLEAGAYTRPRLSST